MAISGSPRLKKKWGQNHLTDGRLCRPLVDFLRPQGRRVVEIGSGGGVLTRELLAAGAAHVLGWEIDPEWAEAARRGIAGEGGVDGDPEVNPDRFSVVVGDALEVDWRQLAADAGEPLLAAGNLPYNVATPILENLLSCHEAVPRAAFLVQKEVGQRLVAGPGDADYGFLSVWVAAHAEASWLGVVSRGSFRPPPKVDGAFIGFRLQPPPLPAAEMPAFRDTVSAAFALRRKTLRNSLASAFGKATAAAVVAALAAEEGWDPRVRAEALGLDELLRLHRRRLEIQEAD